MRGPQADAGRVESGRQWIKGGHYTQHIRLAVIAAGQPGTGSNWQRGKNLLTMHTVRPVAARP
ncbi:hypothetical protein GCM10009504_03190 [Pseudomonas laurentiana]|nr:hypothetical protein GCM10009504_03190 [Pseudomonas laurentiana]